MNAKLKKILDRITNKDVIPEDIPGFYYLKKEDLKCGQVEVEEHKSEYIEEVFEYNARAARARTVLPDIKEAKKGYFTVNLVFMFVALVVLVIYNSIDVEGINVDYCNKAVLVFVIVYLGSFFFNKLNRYLNVLSTMALVIVNPVFVVAIVANAILCYMYDRAVKKIKEEFGYPDFPGVDLILCQKNGQGKKIFAREME